MPSKKAVKTASKSGTVAIHALLDYFSRDTMPILKTCFNDKETLGEEGAEFAKLALEHIGSGNTEDAVKFAIEAMQVYARIEKRNLQLEYAANLSEKWRKNTEPAIRQLINRENCHRRHRVQQSDESNRRKALARELRDEYTPADVKKLGTNHVYKEIGEILARRLNLPTPIPAETVRDYLKKKKTGES